MFPEDTLHCIEWAKDIFGQLFNLMPLSFNKLLSDKSDFNINDPQNNLALKHTLKLLKHKPVDFDSCILIARKKF